MRALPVLLLLSISTTQLSAQVTGNRWYIIRMAGAPVGWTRESRSQNDSGRAISTDMHIAINRMGSQVLMDIRDREVEQVSGTLILDEGSMALSHQATGIRAVVSGDSLRLRVTAAGKSYDRAMPLTVRLIGPAAAESLTDEALTRVGDSVVFHTFAITASAPATVTRTLTSFDTLDVHGRRSARRVIERSSASPVTTTLWLDGAGRTLRTEYESPFGITRSELTDSATALAAGSGADLPDEMYARTLVRTGIKIPQARATNEVRLELTRIDTATPWPDLSAAGQRIVSMNSTRLVIEITRRQPPPGAHRFPVAPTAATRDYLAPNAYVQSDDSALHALALRIVRSETDSWRAALALERWVSDSMHFDLGIAFATSSEILQQRRGTCVAYATILAALTRTLGIPSRIDFGYGYVNGMFGGHAWPEVLIGDRWVPLDAALTARGSADAARFSFTRTSLAGGPNDLVGVPGATLYGAITARVLSYQVEGHATTWVDSGAAPYIVSGDRYTNTYLGMIVTKPSSTRFIALDKTWPSLTVVGIADDEGDTLVIESHPRDPWVRPSTAAQRFVAGSGKRAPSAYHFAGGAGWKRSGADFAVAAVPDGEETLVLRANGPDALSMLERVARSARRFQIPTYGAVGSRLGSRRRTTALRLRVCGATTTPPAGRLVSAVRPQAHPEARTHSTASCGART